MACSGRAAVTSAGICPLFIACSGRSACCGLSYVSWVHTRSLNELAIPQAMAGAPILHMACVLPRIDSGASFPAQRLPTGYAPARGKPQQPVAAVATVAKADRASPRARSTTVNNTDIGGASGGFFNEAEAGAGT